MNTEEPLLDRAGVFMQLQELLTPGSSSSVLELVPPDTRAVWHFLGNTLAETASNHARAGELSEVQQEKALQRLQQLLEAAATGQTVPIENSSEGSSPLLLNGIIPQVLAHKPFTELKDFVEERQILFGPSEGFTDGNRCTNKDQVMIAVGLEGSAITSGASADSSSASSVSSALSPSSMSDSVQAHWRWQQCRVQQFKGRMRRRMGGLKSEEDAEESSASPVKQETSIANTPAPDTVLFPGMVLAVRGRLQQASWSDCGAALVADARSSYKKQNVHIMMASCSFLVPVVNGGWMLRRNALNGLLSAIRELLPHVVILFGPIISWLNLQQPATASGSNAKDPSARRCAPLLQTPEFSLAYAEFFRRLSAAVQGLRTRVVIIPSCRDAMNPEPIPQPPYLAAAEQHLQQLLPNTVHCLGNPCLIQVNDTHLLVSSADPLAEIAGDALRSRASESSAEDGLQQICRALLRQRTLFPRGASPRIPLDCGRLKPLMFDGDNTPHIVAFPSAALTQLQTRGGPSAGACAVDGRIFVSPFNPQDRLEDAFDVTNLYIRPPAEGAEGGDVPAKDADMQLNERVTECLVICAGRYTQCVLWETGEKGQRFGISVLNFFVAVLVARLDTERLGNPIHPGFSVINHLIKLFSKTPFKLFFGNILENMRIARPPKVGSCNVLTPRRLVTRKVCNNGLEAGSGIMQA
ncbi:DNA polymerase alpha [Cyclospora cayetanensis]|uniref:DNA polymerase alpha subunit B n=1 Tax=Cyclospora cayetanensis TaxID=88456 RepID=A0A1D3D5E6_9EIME|nr:DNA polymerase alpha [Cyclospora cayetanensis]